ncbi:MAG: PD40 domain-containing protein [Myxococcales bacterium]|nr:PD40 domain-containing protein [Myxococcales bacterium]
MRSVALIAMLGACGRIGFSDRTGGEVMPDATPDAGDRCAAEQVDLGPFGTPTLISAASATASSEDDPEPSDDGLELFFASDRAGGLGSADLYVLTRATPQAPWSAPVLVTALNSPSYENTPELSEDGLTMWLVSSRPGGVGGEDIWVSTRATRSAGWTPPINVTELNSTQLDRGPTVFAGGLAMWLHSDRQPPQGFYETSRASTSAPWSTPTRTAGPPGIRGWLSPCGLELYFQRDPGMGTLLDLFVARRASTAEAFGAPRRLDDLSSTDYDQDLRLSPDRHHAYFSSRRSNGTDDELYEVSR